MIAETAITPRQHELLTYIIGQPVCPSFPQMARAIQSSRGGVHSMLGRLERAGFIRRLPRRHRAIEAIRQPKGAPRSIEERLTAARARRVAMKPFFDGLYGAAPTATREPYPFRGHRTLAEIGVDGFHHGPVR